MNIVHRIQLLLKGRINAALDRLEDPERSLHQLVHDMEEELDAAKRAVAERNRRKRCYERIGA